MKQILGNVNHPLGMFTPARGWGLKLCAVGVVGDPAWFTPARGWGLKLRCSENIRRSTGVHPRTGVGIETIRIKTSGDI